FFVIVAAAMISVGVSADDLMLVATQPEVVARRAMVQARRAVALGEALVAAGLPPVILGGGDLAGSAGPMYSPADFRRVLLPAYVRALERLNGLGVHYVFRSDGNIWPLMDMLFDQAGCPGFGEADRDAGMTVGAIRERFESLVIWGNVSSVTLTHGSTEEVRRQSRQILAECGGVGCFQGCSNAIVKGTPPENVEAMFSVR
ncbi:MAG: uroporphyrinogen decarboxylase family protein, partial [Planctomycetota bacterium]